MNLQDISTSSILDYLRTERNLIVESWTEVDYEPLFQEVGFEPSQEQLNDFAHYVNSNHDAEVGYNWEVLREFVTLFTEDQLFECDIVFKEDGAETETQQFMGMDTNDNIENHRDYTIDEDIFFYMTKEEAQKLLGVEDNGLDFIITKIY